MRKNDVLGGIFIAAAAFDFKDDDRRLIERYRKQMKDTGVHVLLNTEFKPEDRDGYDEIFVVTGATERKLPTLGFDQPNVRYAVDVLRNQNVRDQNVVIVGGGLTGYEVAYDQSRKNKKVTLVEICPTILNVEGLYASNYNCLLGLMDYNKVDILKNSNFIVSPFNKVSLGSIEKTLSLWYSLINKEWMAFAEKYEVFAFFLKFTGKNVREYKDIFEKAGIFDYKSQK